MSLPRVALAACAIAFVVACTDMATDPPLEPAPLSEHSLATTAAPPDIPLWGPPALATPFRCDTKVAERDQPDRHRSGQIYLHFPQPATAAAGGEIATFRYRRWTQDGVLSREAVCAIPRSSQALELVISRFRLSGNPLLLLPVPGAGEANADDAPSGQGTMTLGMGDECDVDHCLDEVIVDGQCSEGKYRALDGRCYCENGSIEDDCSEGSDGSIGGECDPAFEICGGGGSGPSDGDSYTYENYDLEECNPDYERCVRYGPDDWTVGERAAVDGAIDVIRSWGCGAEADRLVVLLQEKRIELWSGRVERWGTVLYGTRDRDTGYIGVWNGYDRLNDDNVNWTRTLAHEVAHDLYPQWNHDQIFNRAAVCSGDPYRPTL